MQRLSKQLRDLEIPFVDDFLEAEKSSDHIVDAIFGRFFYLARGFLMADSQKGFSFSGEVREPFPAVIKALEDTRRPVTSVDAPSSWSIESGPPASGPGSRFMPCRFVSPAIAKKYDLDIPEYQGLDQVAEVPCASQKL